MSASKLEKRPKIQLKRGPKPGRKARAFKRLKSAQKSARGGRKPGAVNRTTRAAQEIAREEAGRVMKLACKQALSGCLLSQRLVLELALGSRLCSVIHLDNTSGFEDLEALSADLMVKLADGMITPGEALTAQAAITQRRLGLLNKALEDQLIPVKPKPESGAGEALPPSLADGRPLESKRTR
jgi:hypothetical protein